jgi:mRNA interferase HicA
MRGGEFLRKVKAIAKRKKLTCRWSPERGVGSHGTLYLGERFTVVKDLKKLKLYRLMYVAMLPAAISPPGELVAERSV